MTRFSALLGVAFVAATAPGLVGGVFNVDTTTAEQHGQAIAYCDASDRYLSVYVDAGAGGGDLVAAWILPSAGSIVSPTVLDAGATDAFHPVVAWNAEAGKFLVVYQKSGVGPLFGLVLDANGAPAGSGGAFAISSGGGMGQRVVAGNGSWLVTWIDWGEGAGLQGRFVAGTCSNDAVAFGAGPFTIAADPRPGLPVGTPAVAQGTGSDFLVAWDEEMAFNAGQPDYAVRGRRVSMTGSLGAVQQFTPTISMGRSAPVLVAIPERREILLVYAPGVDFAPPYPVIALRIDASTLEVTDMVDLGTAQGHEIACAWVAAAAQVMMVIGGDGVISGRRIDPADLTCLEQGIPITFSGTAWTPAMASRSKGTQVIVQWETYPAPFIVRAQRYDLGTHPLAPDAPSAIEQATLDDASVIAPGTTTNQAGFLAQGGISVGAPGGSFRFQVEVRTVGTPFTGVATAQSAPMAGGATASLAVPLARGADYHWQARTVNDISGHASPWVAFGTDPDDRFQADLSVRSNAAPVAGAATQVGASGALIAVGHIVDAHRVLFGVGATDEDGDLVRMELELRPVTQSFTGLPTSTGEWTVPGNPITLAVDLEDEGRLHWRCRVRDSALDATPWSSFGGNADGETDLDVIPLGSAGVKGCQGSAGPSFAFLPWILLAASLPRSRLRRSFADFDVAPDPGTVPRR